MYNPTKPYTESLLKLVKSTWPKGYAPCGSTDGIGTKGIYHWQRGTFVSATLDALAMNLNDLAVMRVKPTTLHDHILIPEEDEKAILEIMTTLASECKKRNIIINSGETAIHNDLSGLEISITITGEKGNVKPNRFYFGDYLVGIKSSGLHCNGFTKVREIFGNEFRQEFVEPTLIYSDAIFQLINKFDDIGGMVHVTGGAYTKLKKLLVNTDAVITKHSLKPHEIFYELYKRGILDKEMYRTFNCGIGFILGVSEKNVEEIISILKKKDLESCVIGKIVSGTRKVRIESMFGEGEVIF